MHKYLFLIILVILSCSKRIENADELGSADNFYRKGESYYSKNNDSAFIYFNKAFYQYQKVQDTASSINALIYNSIIQNEEGDYYGSEETNIEALNLLSRQKENKNLQSIYNEIAISRRNLKDYKSTLYWYGKAFEFSIDSLEKIKIKNNIAIAQSKLKNYVTSVNILQDLYDENRFIQDKNIESKILDNLAFTKFLQNPNYNAEPELYRALKIREKENDLWGQNASYAHLSDYFQNKDKEKALFYAKNMLEIATKLNSPDDRLEALQKLVLLESSDNSKKHFQQYQKLNDSLQTARAKAKNQFALIRYETEKEKAENAENKIKLLQRNIALGISILAFIIGFFWYKRRKKRLEQEKELEVKNTQLKISKKVHDVSANGLYQVISEIENSDEINKSHILDKLDGIYKKTRDISYEDVTNNPDKDYQQQISALINSFSSDSIKPIVVGNEEELWNHISTEIKSEILLILQELLVNMKKHSQASRFSVIFELDNHQFFLIYTDDGIGLGANFQKNNGLQNMESRIFSCGGTITFDTTIRRGTKILVAFPLN